MKLFKSLLAAACFTTVLLSLSSCVVLHRTEYRTSPGLKKGWNKNSNNPHHPNTTNPGHTKDKSNKKGKK